jgi:uncharacterized membrane protein
MTNSAGVQGLEHRLFLLTVLAKGALGLIQIATAIALLLGIMNRLPAIIQTLIRNEMATDPTDFVANRLLLLLNALPGVDIQFYTIYFAAHGLLHIVVVAALLIGASWAYPAAIAVLAAFVVYQGVEWLAVGGTMLLVLSAIDLVVITLTLLEWRNRRLRAPG